MEENVYAPPKAVLADATSVKNDIAVRFFAVSPVKLVVMSTCTLGIYQIYWFYKNWVLIKEHSEPDITPWARAVFGFFWCFSCFEFIRNDERQLGTESTLAAGPLTVGWIAASLAWRLPEPYYLIGFLSPLLLVPAQQHVNRINGLVAPNHDKNTRLSAWNWLGVVAGGIIIALAVVGVTQQMRHV